MRQNPGNIAFKKKKEGGRRTAQDGPLVTFPVPLATLLPSLRSAKRTMASEPPTDTLSNTGAGARAGGGTGRSANALSQNPYVNSSVTVFVCFFGEGGDVLYVCTGVLNSTNSLKIHPRTVHFRTNKNTRKKKGKENQTANKATSNTKQALW